MMKKILTALFLLVFTSTSGYACSCVFSSPLQALKQDDSVFIGKVVEELKVKRKWKVKVKRVLKGEVYEEITLYASMVNTSCEDSRYKVGLSYVFFANQIDEDEVGQYENGTIPNDEREKIGHYEPWTCSWTTLLTDWKKGWYRDQLKIYKEERFLKMLKNGRKPKKLKSKRDKI